MKTTKKIAEDCELSEAQASILYVILLREKEEDGGPFATTDQLVLKLCRRIEAMEGAAVIYLAEKDREIAQLCDAVNEKKRRIEKLEEEKQHHINLQLDAEAECVDLAAKIEKLEGALAEISAAGRRLLVKPGDPAYYECIRGDAEDEMARALKKRGA